ncbi:MAG: type III-B CRISPR module RAMP protein Cmr4, partial [Bacteroidetes bacterium]
LFAHIVNSNLEVRTSVSIDPATGAAEEGALFSYEALPRGTVLVWEIIAKNPAHFNIGGKPITLGAAQAPTAPAGAAQAPTAPAGANPAAVHNVTTQAHPYLEHLGIGGMGTRGMGRVKVIHANQSPSNQTSNQTVQCNSAASGQTTSSTSQGGQP